MALTASAPPPVEEKIVNSLCLCDPVKVKLDLNRPNIFIRTVQGTGGPKVCRLNIRERGSVLYLGMAKEISKYHTDAPAGKRPKKLLLPKPSMQTE